jgi:hypothetical protein
VFDARWPAVPARDDDSGTPNVHAVFALQSIDIGVTGDAGALGPDSSAPLASFGFDLDNVRTCPGPPSCQQTAGTKRVCDDDAGRDHIALQLFRDLGMSAAMGSNTANAAMQSGEFGILLDVSGYNGQANDRQVTVALYVSNGVGTLLDGGTGMTAKHDGNDKWTVDPAYLLNGSGLLGLDCENNTSCRPEYFDDNAYVNNGVLVASPPQVVPLTFGYRANIGGALMKLNNIVISGTLEAVELPNGGGVGWSLQNGTIAGRWQTSQLLSNMATIPDPLVAGAFICGDSGSGLYPLFKPVICSLQDIASSQSNDNKGLNCDALSMGFGFEAEAARLGIVYGVAPPASGCQSGDSGVLFFDTCP